MMLAAQFARATMLVKKKNKTFEKLAVPKKKNPTEAGV